MANALALAFTKQQLEILDAAFEVLSEGDMTYMVLRLPDLVEAHRELYRKFHLALEMLRCAEERKGK